MWENFSGRQCVQSWLAVGSEFPLTSAAKFQSLFLFTSSSVREVIMNISTEQVNMENDLVLNLYPWREAHQGGYFALEWDFMQEYYLLVPVTVFDNW